MALRLKIGIIGVALLAMALILAPGARAKPTTPEQAKQVVQNWLSLDSQPLGAFLGPHVQEVQTYYYDTGAPVYYVVYLNPSGFVIVSADDLVEPIIAFLPQGRYDPSPLNPLGALVSRDLPARVDEAREVERQVAAQGLPQEATQPYAVAQRKWVWLENPGSPSDAVTGGPVNISDPRVTPLVQSKWNQSNEVPSGHPCYNYYTPYSPTEGTNYVCGCAATSMSQLMRYHLYPTLGIGKLLKSYTVAGTPTTGYTRGGDGNGGPYNWGSMELDPKNNGVTDTQCQAIGALTFDAGISIAMGYNTVSLGGSGASPSKIPGALVNTFKYSNAKYGNTGAVLTSIPASNRNNMVNASLNAGLPVLFGIYVATGGGHSVVGDGYGYNGSTMYHHLNMGWSGYEDAWYNLPDIPTGVATFSSVSNVVYNIFTPDKPVRSSGATEIISGRVTDTSGNPLGGATISWVAVAPTGVLGVNTPTAATGPSGDNTLTAVTGTSGDITIDTVGGVGGGIWSAVFPSGGKYKFTCTKPGYTFPVTWTVGPIAASTDNTINTGNVWQVDFVGSPVATLTFNQALDNNALSFTTSGNANWFPETTTSYYGGSAAQSGAIQDNQVSNLETTVVGPGTLSFYFKVSSEINGDALRWYLDGNFVTGWWGDKDWSPASIAVPKGTHVIKWEYRKNASLSALSDCAWVDKVVYTRGSIVPILPLLLY